MFRSRTFSTLAKFCPYEVAILQRTGQRFPSPPARTRLSRVRLERRQEPITRTGQQTLKAQKIMTLYNRKRSIIVTDPLITRKSIFCHFSPFSVSFNDSLKRIWICDRTPRKRKIDMRSAGLFGSLRSFFAPLHRTRTLISI